MTHLVPADGNPLSALGGLFNALHIPFVYILRWLFQVFDGTAPIKAIGAYGFSIVLLTVLVKVALFPLFQTQLKLTKKSQDEQRRIAPEMAALRKKYKGDAQKLNTEMMALYKEHGINPLSSAAGCLPVLAQMPILIGLYGAFRDHGFISKLQDTHFLWVRNLGQSVADAVGDKGINPSHLLQHPELLVLPLLAGITTYVQSKMFQPAVDPNADEQAQQMAQVSSSMSMIMPLFITYLALQPAMYQGLVLYWIVSNIFSITQQYFVNGWGQLPILGQKTLPPVDSGGGASDKGRGGKPSEGKSAKASGGAGIVGQPQPQLAGRRGRRR